MKEIENKKKEKEEKKKKIEKEDSSPPGPYPSQRPTYLPRIGILFLYSFSSLTSRPHPSADLVIVYLAPVTPEPPLPPSPSIRVIARPFLPRAIPINCPQSPLLFPLFPSPDYAARPSKFLAGARSTWHYFSSIPTNRRPSEPSLWYRSLSLAVTHLPEPSVCLRNLQDDESNIDWISPTPAASPVTSNRRYWKGDAKSKPPEDPPNHAAPR
jgi:hypothetical protein